MAANQSDSGVFTRQSARVHQSRSLESGTLEVLLEPTGDHVAIRARAPFFNLSGQYKKCATEGCLGKVVSGSKTCFAHSKRELRIDILQHPTRHDLEINLQGNVITETLWGEIVQHIKANNGVVDHTLNLSWSQIDANLRLFDTIFNRSIQLDDALLNGFIHFERCVIHGTFSGDFATFSKSGLHVVNSELHGPFQFSGVTCENSPLGFTQCELKNQVRIENTLGSLAMERCTANSDVSFIKSNGNIILRDTNLFGRIRLQDSEIKSIEAQRLTSHRPFEPGICRMERGYFSDAQFLERIDLDITVGSLHLASVKMEQGGLLSIRGGEMHLPGVKLGAPLRIRGRASLGEKMPEITTLANSDAGKMSLSSVDLSRCSFLGTHNLRNVDIDGSVIFGKTPWWLGRRNFIIDEYAWHHETPRLTKFFTKNWIIKSVNVGQHRPPGKKLPPEQLHVFPPSISEVTNLYRELRLSFESKSDMPSASDFYYGEMLLRQHDRSKSLGQRILVAFYGIISGYGLHPLRAFVAWLILFSYASALELLSREAGKTTTWTPVLLDVLQTSLPGLKPTTELIAINGWLAPMVKIAGTVIIAALVISVRSVLMRKPGE